MIKNLPCWCFENLTTDGACVAISLSGNNYYPFSLYEFHTDHNWIYFSKSFFPENSTFYSSVNIVLDYPFYSKVSKYLLHQIFYSLSEFLTMLITFCFRLSRLINLWKLLKNLLKENKSPWLGSVLWKLPNNLYFWYLFYSDDKTWCDIPWYFIVYRPELQS